MTLINDTETLAAFCASLGDADYITVDTEFMREKTFWPQLCLVQIAGPKAAAAIDPLAEGMDLAPLFELMLKPDVLKVFHAARQDVEIFWHLTGHIPAPLFDTQVAAMVCGFGDSVGYETLVAKLTGSSIDKTSRFTDWSQRPLTDRQLAYALSDVTHLRAVYEALRDQLHTSGREDWLSEEMAVLTDPATYELDPEQAWRRLRARTTKPRFIAVLKEVAAWREREAQRRDIPRQRIVRDDTLLEIAAQAPASVDELSRIRGLGRAFAEGKHGGELLAAVERGRTMPRNAIPQPEARPHQAQAQGPIVDLLRVLLKLRCEDHGVAARLVAGTSDLEAIAASDDAPVAALRGWRRSVFGETALALKHGRIALAVTGPRVTIVDLSADRQA